MTCSNPNASACIGCRQDRVRTLRDFGSHPIGHHYVDAHSGASGVHPIVLGACEYCGLAQLIDPIAPAKLTPRVDWIRYNEPEAHLDALVDALSRLPGIQPSSHVVGITYKEDSSLRRFQERGFANTSRLDAALDLGIANPGAGIEWVQHQLKPSAIPQLRERHGSPDLILVRHVIEHTHDTPSFLKAFRQWVAPGGYLVFELPDCLRGFDLLDYTTFWEDHSLYFVESTFRATLQLNGLNVVDFHRFPGAYEHCLVAVAQVAQTPPPTRLDFVPTELARVRRFADQFPATRASVRAQLAALRQTGPMALFGAGHQAATFLSLFGAHDLIDFVIDDHPQKSGRFMPGGTLPIVSSEAAYARGARTWLSTVGAESEPRIAARNRRFFDSGGCMLSIYPTRPDTPFKRIETPR